MAVARTAYRLGITSKLEPNASIALGTSEVSPLELVSAYAPFANGGLAVIPHVVERVRTAEGKTLYTRPTQGLGRIVDGRYVAMMNAMMQQTLVAGTAHTASLPGWQAAGKTGTSQDFRDAWFIGYTAHLVTGVWLGNDDSSPTKKATGGGLPVEIWSRFMKTAHQGVAPTGLPGLIGGAPIATAPTPPANIPDRLPQTGARSRLTMAAWTSGCSTSCWAGADGARQSHHIVLRRSWCFSGSERMRLPVAANTALHTAGASGGSGGSPMPPQKPPLGTSTVITSGMSAIFSIS